MPNFAEAPFPHDVAIALTTVPDYPLWELQTSAAYSFTFPTRENAHNSNAYPVAIDNALGSHYTQAAETLPSTDKQPVILIVGNGALESAAQLFDESHVFLICDRNFATLALQRVFIEHILANESPDEFKENLRTTLDQLTAWHSAQVESGPDESYSADFILNEYQSQKYSWNREQGAAVPYFLQNKKAYETARMALADRAIGMRWIDLRHPMEVADLAQDLNATNAEIVCANTTNVFSPGYAGSDSSRMIDHLLPFAPGAVMISTKPGSGIEPEIHPIEEWPILGGFRYPR